MYLRCQKLEGIEITGDKQSQSIDFVVDNLKTYQKSPLLS